MTTKQERSDRSSTDPVTSLKDEYSLGLNAQEVAILKSLLGTWSGTGRDHTKETRTIRNIYQKLRRSLSPLKESSDDLSHQQQLRELRHTLQEYRRKLNALEEKIEDLEVGDMLV